MLLLKVIFCALFGCITNVSSGRVSEDRSPIYLEQSFFVKRFDTNAGVCVSNDASVLHPVYEFDENAVPDGGFRWNMSHTWQLSNLEASAVKNDFSHTAGDTYLITDGSRNFTFLDEEEFLIKHNDVSYLSNGARESPRINILAANATLLLTGSKNWQGEGGTLLEIDHFNPQTNSKETRVKVCRTVFLEDERNCEIVFHENQTNYLKDGKDYGTFFIEKWHKCSPPTYTEQCDVAFYLLHFGKSPYDRKGEWTRQMREKQNFVFARSDKGEAVFLNEKQLCINPIAEQASTRMSKEFTHPSNGKLVVHVEWRHYSSDNFRPIELYVENLATGHTFISLFKRTDSEGLVYMKQVSKAEFKNLKAGDYRIKIYNIAAPIQKITLCSANVCAPEENKIQHQRVVGCHLFLGEMLLISAERTVSDSESSSSQSNSMNVSPNWNADDWSYVCAQLGIGRDADSNVDIKLCNVHGCVISTCPLFKKPATNGTSASA